MSVCDGCPTKRSGKGRVCELRRFTSNPCYQLGRPLGEMQCFLEQGLLCMGPATLGGCAGGKRGAMRCIEALVPCRGCYRPVRPHGNQLLDMLNLLASNGVDLSSVPDRMGPLRFSGAHRRLNHRPWAQKRLPQ